MIDWAPSSWKSKQACQQPAYPDAEQLAGVLRRLSRLPPLVTSWEIERLRQQLAEAERGERFLLQGGDCAESFDECSSPVIANKLKILLQMSLILVHGSGKRVTRIGRFAGQYAKPRSEDYETRDGVTLPTYRGDLVNGPSFDLTDRVPDPERLLRGYERAALTLNFIRSLTDGGFADLHHPEYWDLDFVRHSPMEHEYRRIVDSIGQSLRYMETLVGVPAGVIDRVDFFASHEGLHLLYEEAQTRRVPHRPGWYNLSTHFPWIGNRTRNIDGAHVEYFRGIENPIGVKVGPTMEPDELVALARILNPNRIPGRLTIIHRFGADNIQELLPPLIDSMKKAGFHPLWICDPMHGNTERTVTGIKTRDFANIVREVEAAFEVHHEEGQRLGGIHFELTGDNVTECIGGARGISEEDLSHAYQTRVDPRLNYEQALEIAMVVAQRMAKLRSVPAAH